MLKKKARRWHAVTVTRAQPLPSADRRESTRVRVLGSSFGCMARDRCTDNMATPLVHTHMMSCARLIHVRCRYEDQRRLSFSFEKPPSGGSVLAVTSLGGCQLPEPESAS